VSSGTLGGIATAILLVLFIGICIWAYSARRRSKFDAAARMPLEDDNDRPAPPAGVHDEDKAP
jgi:cytochrome c oxidase cbb3-type subunit IV